MQFSDEFEKVIDSGSKNFFEWLVPPIFYYGENVS